MRRFQNSTTFWQIERRGSSLVITAGKRRSAGKAVTKEHGSEADAAKEYERLIAEKRREKYVEVKVGAAPVVDRVAVVVGLLNELRALGARVETTTPPDANAIAAAEQTLGFGLPNEYRAFLGRFGQITVERDGRTAFFYGLPAAVARTKEYGAALDGWRKRGGDAGYYPSRFVVLFDEGEHSNLAEGKVYDDGLKAIVATRGGEPVDTEADARATDCWTFLVAELKALRDRLDEDHEGSD